MASRSWCKLPTYLDELLKHIQDDARYLEGCLFVFASLRGLYLAPQRCCTDILTLKCTFAQSQPTRLLQSAANPVADNFVSTQGVSGNFEYLLYTSRLLQVQVFRFSFSSAVAALLYTFGRSNCCTVRDDGPYTDGWHFGFLHGDYEKTVWGTKNWKRKKSVCPGNATHRRVAVHEI